MKNLQTGEMSGPPLEHEEWIENQRKLEVEEAKQRDAKKHPHARATSDSHHKTTDAKK